MIPEKQDMAKVALNLDRILHLEGHWGASPSLGFVLHAGIGYVSAMYPQQPKNLRELDDLADRIERGAYGSRQILQRHGLTAAGDSIAGLYFIHEGRVRFDGRMTKTRIRSCVLVDCAGRTYVLLRTDGEPGVVLATLEPGEEHPPDSRTPLALRRLLRAVSAYMAPDAVDRKGLAW